MKKKVMITLMVLVVYLGGFSYGDTPLTPVVDTVIDTTNEEVTPPVDNITEEIKPAVIPDFATLGAYYAQEVAANKNLVVTKQEITLSSGFYAAQYTDVSAIVKMQLISSDMTVQTYEKPAILPQRDIFELNTYTNGIEIVTGGKYVILTYSKTNKPVGLVMKKYTKRTSAMSAADLKSWSNSYTDTSRLSVLSNGVTYVNMAKYAPEIISFSQVSTTLNRTHKVLDREDIIIQRKDFADMLIKVNSELMTYGYRLLIYDGYRTKESTKALYAYTLADIKKPTHLREYPEITLSNMLWYVVKETSSSDRHGKGTAADVTLVKMSTGEVINMPTRVNTMNLQAWVEVTKEKSSAYTLLYNTMKKYGVRPYDKEWYHFSHVAVKESNPPPPGLRASFYPGGDLGLQPASWAATPIKTLVAQKVIPNENYAYKTAITREAFVTHVMQYVEKETEHIISLDSPFRDTKMSGIAKAYTTGVIALGYDKQFNPTRPITREEVAVVLTNATRYINMYKSTKAAQATEILAPEVVVVTGDLLDTTVSETDTEEIVVEPILVTPPSSTPLIFKDMTMSSEWALSSIRTVVENKWLNGTVDGYFKPKAYLTQEEAFVVLFNVYNATGNSMTLTQANK